MSCAKCTSAGWGSLARAAAAGQVREKIEKVSAAGYGRIVKAGAGRRPSVGHGLIATDRSTCSRSV
jgi:hypothetical protein